MLMRFIYLVVQWFFVWLALLLCVVVVHHHFNRPDWVEYGYYLHNLYLIALTMMFLGFAAFFHGLYQGMRR